MFLVLKYDFNDSLGYLVSMTAMALQQAINLELAPHGITFRQTQVLAWLAHDGKALTQGELATRMGIEPPTLVGILDRMEQHGWITRESCPEDRRKKIVRPAEAAEEVWETMVNSRLQVRRMASARLTPEEVDKLKDLLRIVYLTLLESDTLGGSSGDHALPQAPQ